MILVLDYYGIAYKGLWALPEKAARLPRLLVCNQCDETQLPENAQNQLNATFPELRNGSPLDLVGNAHASIVVLRTETLLRRGLQGRQRLELVVGREMVEEGGRDPDQRSFRGFRADPLHRVQCSFRAHDLVVPGLDETAGEPLELLARLDEETPVGDLDGHLLARVSGPDVQAGVLRNEGGQKVRWQKEEQEAYS
jgi:hypothetical protein